MKIKRLIVAALCAAGVSFAFAESVDSVPKFRRSSLYTILVKSAAQDANLDKELTSSGNLVSDLVGAFVSENKDTTETAGMSKSQIAQREFLKVEIPNQFNDHNLDIRVLDFDAIKVTPEEIAASVDEGTSKKKKGGFGKALGKGLLAATTGADVDAMKGSNSDSVDAKLGAVLRKFYVSEEIAPKLVAKWFGYANGKYDENLLLIKERGLQDASEAAKQEAAMTHRHDAKLMDAGQELIDNTFVLAVNLRYRSNKAIIAEAQQAANAVGSMFGSYGAIASQAAGAVASAAAGKGFGIQVLTYLYKLNWDKEKLDLFYSQYWDKPLEELVKAGICELQFIGKDKASARVVASGFSNKPEAELIKDAVQKAIDKAIVKLQVKHEVFRTKTPIFQIDEKNRFVYAQIGTKEGVEKGDEYEILEAVEEDGNTKYNVVGKVKAVEGAIWNNEVGAEDELKEAEAEGDKKTQEKLAAISLKASKFEIKKGKDLYPGMLLRLSKKK